MQACRAEFPLLVDVEALLLPDPEHLLKTVQHALDDANDFSAHHLRLRLANPRPGTEHKVAPRAARSALPAGTSTVEEDETVAAILRLTPGASGSAHSYGPLSALLGARY